MKHGATNAAGILLVLLLLPAGLCGQDTKLIEAAKKEGGKVVVYG